MGVVQTKLLANASYVNTFTISPASAFTSGDQVFLAMGAGKTSGPNPITSISGGETSGYSWTRLGSLNSGAYSYDLWTCKSVAGGTPTITVNTDGYYASANILREYSGAPLGAAFIANASAQYADSGYVSSRTVGPTSPSSTIANTLALAVYAGNNSTNNVTTPTGYGNASVANGQQFDSVWMADKTLSSSGVTESITVATSQSVNGAGAIFILGVSGGGGGAQPTNKFFFGM